MNIKFSIQTKLFLTVGLIILFFTSFLIASHFLFYGRYTLAQNKNTLTETYQDIRAQLITKNRSTFTTSMAGMQIIFLNENYDVLSGFVVEKDGSIRQKISDTEEATIYEQEIIAHHDKFNDDGYFIYTQKNSNIDEQFLTLIGTVPLGDNLFYVVLRISVPAIEANIAYSRFFILISGIITLLLAMIGAYLISRHWVKPILEINTITKAMANLDFSKKFSGKTSDEIGELGENINVLSGRLEEAIDELQHSNARLEKDIKKERQIDEMRQNLIANVSHDLKTPLAIIQGYAEGLRENISESPEDREFYTSVIIEESDRMNKLVRQILNLSQLELGKIKPEFESFEITSYIDVIIGKFSLMFKEKDIRIENRVDEHMIIADSNMLSQVLVNLITNAADHTAAGDRIIVSGEERGDKLRLNVFNEGEPIPEDEMDKIWLSFYKRNKARSGKYGGTGIGLTIVKTIMGYHNNDCGVYNTENGVNFWVEFDIDAGGGDDDLI